MLDAGTARHDFKEVTQDGNPRTALTPDKVSQSDVSGEYRHDPYVAHVFNRWRGPDRTCIFLMCSLYNRSEEVR